MRLCEIMFSKRVERDLSQDNNLRVSLQGSEEFAS